MTGTRQFNVRVPDEARAVLTRIATRIRDDVGFIERVEGWLDTLDDPTADDSLAERVARIEARLDEVITLITPTGTPDDNPPLAIGQGRGVPLEDERLKDLKLRIGAGQSEEDIADATGVSLGAIRAWRKRIAGQA